MRVVSVTLPYFPCSRQVTRLKNAKRAKEYRPGTQTQKRNISPGMLLYMLNSVKKFIIQNSLEEGRGAGAVGNTVIA